MYRRRNAGDQRGKEDVDMAVLVKDMKMSFELDSKKVSDFLKNSDKTAFDRAMKRASSHKKDRTVGEWRQCTNTANK